MMSEVEWGVGTLAEANSLLLREHYLGPIKAGGARLVVSGTLDGELVAVQVWRKPTTRWLPNDGTWLELSRWCLTPEAGLNAGSRQHAFAVKCIRRELPETQILVSYSDREHGHGGSLYRACNWRWAPTWMRLRPPPGKRLWTPDGKPQSVKDRWVYPMTRRALSTEHLRVKDRGAVRHWLAVAPEAERSWSQWHPDLNPNSP